MRDTKAVLAKIKRLALEIDHKEAFGGKSKGNRHLFRVVKLAKHLAKRLGADLDIVEAGAWLHDTALPSGDDYDYEKNKAIVTAILRKFRLSPAESDAIAECVASHEGTVRSKTLEAKIVHDADVLEKSGLLGVIRHTWKLTNLGRLAPEGIGPKDAKHILAHLKWRSARLHTPLARRIRAYLSAPLSPKAAVALIRIIAARAADGVVTERIARSLYQNLTKAQQDKLRLQLNQRYLRRF